MTDDDFSLPGSSLDEIEKIIEAHAQRDSPSSNADIAKLAGLDKTTVSRNNKFLVCTGVLEGGNKKTPTEVGQKLGHALHHEKEGDVRKFWQQVVTGNSFLSEQLTAVRVQKGVKSEDLASNILYNAGAKKNKHSETGSKAVADVLVRAGLLEERDGKFQVAKGPSPKPEKAVPEAEPDEEPSEDVPSVEEAPPRQDTRRQFERPFQLAVNLQLQLPEFDDTSKYEELFKALREQLLAPNEE